MILDDPELPGIAAILFDEFHERSLDGFRAGAGARRARRAAAQICRLLVMSATVDGARVARLLGDCAPVIESAGRSFRSTSAMPSGRRVRRSRTAVAATMREALATEDRKRAGLPPGQREILAPAERLEGRVAETVDVVPLCRPTRCPHAGRGDQTGAGEAAKSGAGDLDRRDLHHHRRRCGVVIDSGLSRVPRYEPASGLTRLETVRVSRASADQRAGRAGRTQPGVAIRLWRAEQTASLAAYNTPEILEADLSSLLLDCAAFGVADPARCPSSIRRRRRRWPRRERC